jgi:hypothetical protein
MTHAQARREANSALAELTAERREKRPTFDTILRTVENFDFAVRDARIGPFGPFPGHEGRAAFNLKHTDKDADQVADALHRLGGPARESSVTKWRLVIDWRRTSRFTVQITAQVKP